MQNHVIENHVIEINQESFTGAHTPSSVRRRAVRSTRCAYCSKTIHTGDWITPRKPAERKSNAWIHQQCAEHHDQIADGFFAPVPAGRGWGEEFSAYEQLQRRLQDPASNTVPLTPAGAAIDLVGEDDLERAAAEQRTEQRADDGESDGDGMDPTDQLTQGIGDILQAFAELRHRTQNQAPKPQLTVQINGGEVRTVEGKTHPKFAWIVKLATARKNILLVGPTGCGKTHLAGQLAEALGLSFGFVSCSGGLSEGQLYGRLLPTGDGGKFEYVPAGFSHAYENGGVFLLDELDASDENTLIAINSALANGHMCLPNRPGNPIAARHHDFVCIAAANTYGSGADRRYVGRNRLDEATLDRFRIGTVDLDYDPEIESALCPDDLLREEFQKIRENITKHRLERVMSTRTLRDGYDMLCVGATHNEVVRAYFTGWPQSEIKKVTNVEVQS